jgi:hypothetical protein
MYERVTHYIVDRCVQQIGVRTGEVDFLGVLENLIDQSFQALLLLPMLRTDAADIARTTAGASGFRRAGRLPRA